MYLVTSYICSELGDWNTPPTGREAALAFLSTGAEAMSAASLIRRVQGRKVKLVVNYEHAEPAGSPLPAAGWIDPASLAYVPGTGLTALVDWLPRARELLASGEYAYLSPVIRYDASTGAVLDLLLGPA